MRFSILILGFKGLTCKAVAFKGMLHANIINPIISPALLSNTLHLTPPPPHLSDYPLPFSGDKLLRLPLIFSGGLKEDLWQCIRAVIKF